ncbi:MAG TPA: TPM domain-containing protein [Bacteroidales bacterium]|nr:TPM domain-containing protein [Bacteroidales bacterium]
MTPPLIDKYFTPEQKEDIRRAIMNAELESSGEIKIHIENICKGDVMDRATQVFNALGMDKTRLRNGVLIYLALKNRKFAIIGDVGINAVVPNDFWEGIKQFMLNHFREGNFAEGLCEAIAIIGKQLGIHFPRKKSDINELSDEISYNNN